MDPPPGSPPDDSTITLPKGWTNDKAEMNYDYYWGDGDSDGQVMARNHGLKSPEATMCNTKESGDSLYMFRSDHKYYLWNLIEGDVWEIQKPVGLKDIVKVIGEKGVGSLTIELVPVARVSTSG